VLEELKIVMEVSGRRRDRVYANSGDLEQLAGDSSSFPQDNPS
jgi:hypothetical protein